jgi:hypothetical protein
MIKTSVCKLVGAMQCKALAHVAEAIPPGGYHFKLAKLLAAIDVELAEYQKQQQSLIRKFGAGLDGNTIAIDQWSPENKKNFNAAMTELLDVEITFSCEPIVWSRLGEDGQMKLTVGDILMLGDLIIETDLTAPPKDTPST